MEFKHECAEQDIIIDQASMELKISSILATLQDFRKESADKESTIVQASPACFICDSTCTGHKLAACPDREFCMGCGGNVYPYEKCDDQLKVCEWCNTLGHSAKVHNTNQISLRTRLLISNPTAFQHFCSPPKYKGQRGPRVGLSREDRPNKDHAANDNTETSDVQDYAEGRGRGT